MRKGSRLGIQREKVWGRAGLGLGCGAGPGDLEAPVALGWAWVWIFGSSCFQPLLCPPSGFHCGGGGGSGDGGCALCRWIAAHFHANEVLMSFCNRFCKSG